MFELAVLASVVALVLALKYLPAAIDSMFGLFIKPRYQYIMEVIRRCRSCYIYTLKPRRFKWVARYYAQWESHFRDADGWFHHTHEVRGVLAQYKNWMGENRVGG